MCMPIENYPYKNFYARLRPVPSFGYSGAPSEAGERFDLRSCCYSFPAPRPCIFPWNLAPCALCLVPLFYFLDPRSSNLVSFTLILYFFLVPVFCSLLLEPCALHRLPFSLVPSSLNLVPVVILGGLAYGPPLPHPISSCFLPPLSFLYFLPNEIKKKRIQLGD
jgi:hypothetical protein